MTFIPPGMSPAELATGLHYNVDRIRALSIVDHADAVRAAGLEAMPGDLLKRAGATESELNHARIEMWKAQKLRDFQQGT